MKTIPMIDKSTINEKTCCSSDNNQPKDSISLIKGYLKTPAGDIPKVSSDWTNLDRFGRIRSRISAFRMKYTVKPGLYALGNPDNNSDVFVSSNYKLSFDILRRGLYGTRGWILVLDTKGINVWCAAGKGTFGTAELVKRIIEARLAMVVSHKRIIVPQLGATGVRASEVTAKTGFRIYYGPVYARDTVRFVDSGYRATPEMRLIRFTLADRLVLTPMELNPALKKYPLFALAVFIIFGLEPTGILFKSAWNQGWPFILMGLIAIIAGGFLTPLFLPFIPFRPFAIKGWIVGAAVTVPVLYTIFSGDKFSFLTASAFILFPLISSYLALQFTGSTTFTGMSGVKKELRIAVPIYIGGAAVSFLLLIIYKIISWGII